MNKQISLTIPETLFKASRSYSKEMGFRNVQELILDSLRRRAMADLEEDERLRKIEEDMDRNPNIRTFKTKEEALAHLDSL
jgi:cell fate (sporulation/competence/biofilm development) regulator YlbF (YheA/YmcA/DUF963 family)